MARSRKKKDDANIKRTTVPLVKVAQSKFHPTINRIGRWIQDIRHHGSMAYKLCLIRSIDIKDHRDGINNEPPLRVHWGSTENDQNDMEVGTRVRQATVSDDELIRFSDQESSDEEDEVERDATGNDEMSDVESDGEPLDDEYEPSSEEDLSSSGELLSSEEPLPASEEPTGSCDQVSNWEDAVWVVYRNIFPNYKPRLQKYEDLNNAVAGTAKEYYRRYQVHVPAITGYSHIIEQEASHRVVEIETNLRFHFVQIISKYVRNLRGLYLKWVSWHREQLKMGPEDVLQGMYKARKEIIMVLKCLGFRQMEDSNLAWPFVIPRKMEGFDLDQWVNDVDDTIQKEARIALGALETLNWEALKVRSQDQGKPVSPFFQKVVDDIESLKFPPKEVGENHNNKLPRTHSLNHSPHLFIEPYSRLSKLFADLGFANFNAVPTTSAFTPQFFLIDTRTVTRSILKLYGDEHGEVKPIYWHMLVNGKNKSAERLHKHLHAIKSKIRKYKPKDMNDDTDEYKSIRTYLEKILKRYEDELSKDFKTPFLRSKGTFRGSMLTDGYYAHLHWNMDISADEVNPEDLAPKSLVEMDFRLHAGGIINVIAEHHGVSKESVMNDMRRYGSLLVFWDFNKRDIFVARQFDLDENYCIHRITYRYSLVKRRVDSGQKKYRARSEEATRDAGINLVFDQMGQSKRKTFDEDELLLFLDVKNDNFETLKAYYSQPFILREKRNRVVGIKAADAILLKELKKTFEHGIHIAGHWTDAGRTAKYQPPTVSIGIRRLALGDDIHFYLCDEHNTSQYCPAMSDVPHELKLADSDKIRLSFRPQQRVQGNKWPVHGEKVCTECGKHFQNRDYTATENMMMNAYSWLSKGKGLEQFYRSNRHYSIPLEGKTYTVQFLDDKQPYYMGCDICLAGPLRCECDPDDRVDSVRYILLIVDLIEANKEPEVKTRAALFGKNAWDLVGLGDEAAQLQGDFLDNPIPQYSRRTHITITLLCVRPPSQPNYHWVIESYDFGGNNPN